MPLPIKHNNTITGIVLLLLSTVMFALQDAISKQLISSVAVGQIMLARFTVFSVFAIVYASMRIGLAVAARSMAPGKQLFRCVIMCSEIGIFAYALNYLGVAEIHAIFSCFPLVVTALSVPLLGETVGWRRWLAVIVGFCGTLIILQPGTGVFNPWALVALLCVLLYSTYNIMTRLVSRYDSFETSLLYFGVVGLVLSIIVVIGRWQPVDSQSAWLLAGIAVTSLVSHILLIKALQLAAATVLQPFNYFILVWAILFGYVFFGETLSIHQVVGAVIVVCSGLYIGLREYALARNPQPE